MAALTLPISSEAKSLHLVQIIILSDEPRAPYSRSVLLHAWGFGALPFSQCRFLRELAERPAAENQPVGAKVPLTWQLRPAPSGLCLAAAPSVLLPKEA